MIALTATPYDKFNPSFILKAHIDINSFSDTDSAPHVVTLTRGGVAAYYVSTSDLIIYTEELLHSIVAAKKELEEGLFLTREQVFG